jgi:hypothetical protein
VKGARSECSKQRLEVQKPGDPEGVVMVRRRMKQEFKEFGQHFLVPTRDEILG